MEQYGMTMEHALYTENIHYPIVIMSPGEKNDVEPWITLSHELVEDDWTDMRKVLAFYDYCFDNLMYDYWIAHKTDRHARWRYYRDYTGKYYISNTHIGVCEDFANVIAIMCRANNIPAFVSNTEAHAWEAIYIRDYNRWISMDISEDMYWYVGSEDMNDIGNWSDKRYRTVDYVAHIPTQLHIGNYEDMKRHGIFYPWQ